MAMVWCATALTALSLPKRVPGVCLCVCMVSGNSHSKVLVLCWAVWIRHLFVL